MLWCRRIALEAEMRSRCDLFSPPLLASAAKSRRRLHGNSYVIEQCRQDLTFIPAFPPEPASLTYLYHLHRFVSGFWNCIIHAHYNALASWWIQYLLAHNHTEFTWLLKNVTMTANKQTWKNMNITSEQNIKFMSYIKAQSKFALL